MWTVPMQIIKGSVEYQQHKSSNISINSNDNVIQGTLHNN